MTLAENSSSKAQDASKAASLSSKLNWLRAGVLGANDGIVSTALLLFGVAVAGAPTQVIALSGVSAVIAGAVSMSVGEYVSVSAQRDTEEAVVRRIGEAGGNLLPEDHERLQKTLTDIGVEPSTAAAATEQMAQNSPHDSQLFLEYGLDADGIVSPWPAAFSSAFAFILGSILPLTAALISPADIRVPVIFGVTILTLALTGIVSGKLSDSPAWRSSLRLVIGGLLGMAISYGVGSLFNTPIG